MNLATTMDNETKKRGMSVFIDPALHHKAKLFSVEHRKSLVEVVEDALTRYLEEARKEGAQ